MADNLALKGNEARYAMRYMRLKLGRRTSPDMKPATAVRSCPTVSVEHRSSVSSTD